MFSILYKTGGLVLNPFNDIARVEADVAKKDAFEIEELRAIDNYLTTGKLWDTCIDPKTNLIILKSIFIIGLNTGLRRGDIALLKWESVGLKKNRIELFTGKTKTFVSIPMTEALSRFINEQRENEAQSEYVTPELAELYNSNPASVNYRFKKMLSDIGIKTNKTTSSGRTASSKGCHSLRHSFAYLHGIQKTPVQQLQSMLGHLSNEMTYYYQLHQTEHLKAEAQKGLETFTNFLISDTNSYATDAEKLKQVERLVREINTDNAEGIKAKILEVMK